MTTKPVYKTDRIVSPGDALAWELKERGWTQGELARRIGYSRPTVTAIIHGRSAVTAEIAEALFETLGTPASLWLNLERQYRTALAARQQRRLASNP
jgi:HTH-type transcriptional regulator/antitoxin HigA